VGILQQCRGYANPNDNKRFQELFGKVEKNLAARGSRYFVEVVSLDESGVYKGS